MTIRERVEQNVIAWLLGTSLAGFVAGFGAYEAILRVSERTTVSKERLAQLEEIERRALIEPESAKPSVQFGAADAEKLVNEWVGALIAQDIDTIVSQTDTPFYFDNQILVRRPDVRDQYVHLFAAKPRNSDNDWQIKSLMVKTIGSLKREGYDERRDRVLTNLQLSDDDYVGIVMWGKPGRTDNEGMLLFLRRKADGFKVAGTWD